MRKSIVVALAALCFGCGDDNSHAARVARHERNVLANRDPDKAGLFYGCLTSGVGASFSNWRALYGDTLVRDSVQADGSEVWRVDQWQAVPGPDYITRQLYITFKDWRVIGIARFVQVQPADPDYCAGGPVRIL